MIKELQRKYMLITMTSVTVVMLVILLAINIASYYKVRQFSDKLVEYIVANDGKISASPEGFPQDKPDMFNRGMTKETPFETRYFSVIFDEKGEVFATDTKCIFAVDESTAISYAEEVKSGRKEKGYYNGIYRFAITDVEEGTLVVFVDCSRLLETSNVFLGASAMIFVVGVIAIIGLAMILSHLAIKPVAESLEKQKHFVTDAGHELKTPLTIISANNEILEMENGENEWTQSIAKQVARMTALTKSLTMLAKMDEGNSDFDSTEFSLSDAVSDTVESFSAPAKSGGKELAVSVENGIQYTGDERLIRQLAGILMDNALKYSRGKISVRLFRHKNKSVLEVSNDVNGEIGDTSKYFDRFYRADTSRSSSIEGSGIGLSIAKEITGRHKGKIVAESSDDGTVTIRVTL